MRGGLLVVVVLITLTALWSSVELYVAFIRPSQQRELDYPSGVVSESKSECMELLIAGGCDSRTTPVPSECRQLCQSLADANASTPAARIADSSDVSFTGASEAGAGAGRKGEQSSPSATEAGGANVSLGCEAVVPTGRCFDEPSFMLHGKCRSLCAAYRGLPREAEQWVSLPSCFARGAPGLARARKPVLDTHGYFQLVGGREQMNKNRFLVLDALYYARALNRTFVEPAMSNSRIVRPRLTGLSGNASGRAPSMLSLGFGSYWEMKSVCRVHRTLDVNAFSRIRVAHGLRAVLVLPNSVRETRIGALNFAHNKGVREAFAPFSGYPVIQMDGFYRSSNEKVVPLKLSPSIELFAKRLAAQLLGKRYMAVQWRSETVSRERWEPCVRSVATVIRRLAQRFKFPSSQVLFLSDVFPETSDTHKLGEQARQLAFRILEEALPGMMTHPIHDALAMIGDSGIKAITEQFLAVNAPHFFAASMGESHQSREGACAKPGSGFVDTIVREREQRGLRSFPLLHMRMTLRGGRTPDRRRIDGGPGKGASTQT